MIYLPRGYRLYSILPIDIMWLIVTSYSQPQINTEIICNQLTNESIGLIILITSLLTTKYKLLHILPQSTSLEVINISHQGATPALLTTNMTAYTPDELIVGFPQDRLLNVTGEPTFKNLNIIRRYLNTNAMSVSS
jgi:hypothetical protein